MLGFSRQILRHALFFSFCVGFGLASSQVWALPHPYFSKHPKQAKKLEELLQQTSLKPLEPQPADLSIALTDLKGNPHPLSRHRGNVLLLTRWATWCHACKAEMPFKMRLKDKLSSSRFALIGISDEDRETVINYTRTAPTMYPISLLDPRGLMQKFFPGGAIPVSILIDGWGWVVAMKVGGAQWDTTPYVELHKFLLSLAPTAKQLKQREKVPAPQVTFSKYVKVNTGQLFTLAFSMRWRGEQDKYRRILLRVPKEKGLQVLGVETSGISADKEGNHRTYTLRMKATKAGKHTLDPILLNYWIKDYDGHFQTTIGSVTIQATSLLSVNKKKAPAWALGMLGAAIFLLLFAVFVARQKKTTASKQKNREKRREQELQELKEVMAELKRAHKDKNWKAFFYQARNVRQAFIGQKDAELNELDEAFQYGGQEPNEEQITAIQQRLYRDLQEDYPELES